MKSNKPSHSSQLGLILDMDGTLMKGDEPLPGLAQLFTFLRHQNIPYMVVTNNATHSPQDYQQKLVQCGVHIEQDKIFTTAMATATTLQGQFPKGTALFVIGQPALVSSLVEAGFRILTNSSEPAAAVVVGGDPSLTYDKLKHATLHIQRGSQFIGTNPDIVYPTEEGLVPECGTTLAALQAATGDQPMIIGKPNPTLFNQAVASLQTSFERTFVVGDRLETDILGGQRAGCKTILITTGVDQVSSVIEYDIHPDYIVKNLSELTRLLQNLL